MIDRPIRFYCRECGKEIYKGIDYEVMGDDSFETVLRSCICSDCILQEVIEERKAREKGKSDVI